MEQPPFAYVVDVCATCGKLAVWPFCEHHDLRRPWTIALKVVVAPSERQRLRHSMEVACSR